MIYDAVKADAEELAFNPAASTTNSTWRSCKPDCRRR